MKIIKLTILFLALFVSKNSIAQNTTLETYKLGEGLNFSHDNGAKVRFTGYIQPYMDSKHYTGDSNFIESLLFASGRPLRLSEIRSILENEGIKVDLAEIKVGLNNLEERYAESSLELSEVASGFRLQIKKDFTHLLSSLWTENNKLSKSLMETISIIAYKQPVTRGEIEEIRGVQVSTNIVRNLLERDWVKISGYKETPGRPALLVTTKTFLNDLNIKKISDLPTLPEKEEVSQEEITDNTEINLEAG